MSAANNNKREKLDPTFRRTSISAVGKITETQMPLSALKKEAIDLSANSRNPTSLLLTREAAMRITEQAITSALESAWSELISEKEASAIASETLPVSGTSVEKNKTIKQTKSAQVSARTPARKLPSTARGSEKNPKSIKSIKTKDVQKNEKERKVDSKPKAKSTPKIAPSSRNGQSKF